MKCIKKQLFVLWFCCAGLATACTNNDNVPGGGSGEGGGLPSGEVAGVAGATSPATTDQATGGSSISAAGAAANAGRPGVSGKSDSEVEIGGAGGNTDAVGSDENTGAAGSGENTNDGDGNTGAAGSDGTTAASDHEDLGKGDGSDVICIGDSWMNLGMQGIQQSLLVVSGQPYRVYGVPGTRLLNEQIPNQYESAKRINPDIKTVIMTGGGNDILLTGVEADCNRADGVGDVCKEVLDQIFERLDELWTEMGADGVQDVIYIEYSRGGLTNEKPVNYSVERLGPICTNHTAIRCHYFDSDPVINRVLQDGIHPTAVGDTQIATAVFELMEKEGMRR